MKTMNLRNFVMVMVLSVLAISVSAQRMHKQPRIKVKANKVEMNTVSNEKETSVTSSLINDDASANQVTIQNETASVSASAEVKSVKRNLVSSSVEVKESKGFHFPTLSSQLSSSSELMKVKEVKKTALEKWVMWMIILFGAALLFTILGAVFFFSLSLVLGYIFYIIGALCWLGGGIVLVLGLVGAI